MFPASARRATSSGVSPAIAVSGPSLEEQASLNLWDVYDRYLAQVGSAPSPEPVYLKLNTEDPARIHLHVTDVPDRKRQEHSSLRSRVLEELEGGEAMTRKLLREKLSVKNERLGEALKSLEREEKLERSEKGWRSLTSSGECGRNRPEAGLRSPLFRAKSRNKRRFFDLRDLVALPGRSGNLG
jgi:hypothetical protein